MSIPWKIDLSVWFMRVYLCFPRHHTERENKMYISSLLSLLLLLVFLCMTFPHISLTSLVCLCSLCPVISFFDTLLFQHCDQYSMNRVYDYVISWEGCLTASQRHRCIHAWCTCVCQCTSFHSSVGNNCWVFSHNWVVQKSNPPPTFCLMIGSGNSFLLYNWLLPSAPPFSLVLLGLLLGYIRSSCIWAALWMFTAALLQTECRGRPDSHTHKLIQEHTHSHRFIGRHRMHPGNTLALLLNLLVLTLTHQSAQLG